MEFGYSVDFVGVVSGPKELGILPCLFDWICEFIKTTTQHVINQSKNVLSQVLLVAALVVSWAILEKLLGGAPKVLCGMLILGAALLAPKGDDPL